MSGRKFNLSVGCSSKYNSEDVRLQDSSRSSFTVPSPPPVVARTKIGLLSSYKIGLTHQLTFIRIKSRDNRWIFNSNLLINTSTVNSDSLFHFLSEGLHQIGMGEEKGRRPSLRDRVGEWVLKGRFSGALTLLWMGINSDF